MNLNGNEQNIAEQFVDLVDVLSETINEDGLRAIADTCLHISGLDHCAVFLMITENSIEESTNVSKTGFAARVNSSEPSPLALLSMNALSPQISISGNAEELHTEYAFPLRVRGQALGVISLESASSTPLPSHTIAILQSVADLSASSIYQSNQIQQTRTLVAQLQGALTSRVLVEQAKGVLAERLKIDFCSAFQEIRNTARREQRKIHLVASDIVSTIN